MSSDYPNPDPELIPEYRGWLKIIGRSKQTIDGYCSFLRTINNEMTRENSTNIKEHLANDELPGLKGKIVSYRSYLRFLWKEKARLTAEQYQDAIEDFFKIPKQNQNSDNLWAVPFEQWEDVIRKAPNRVAKMGFWLGFNFGLRLGEILHLRIQDIVFDKQELSIRIQKQIKNKYQESWYPKNKKERTLPFTVEQADVFHQWIDDFRPKTLLHPYLLWTPRPRERGKESSVLRRSFQYWCTKAGIHAHILRYSFATHYYNQSLDVKLISELLGHSNVSTTSDYLKLGKNKIMSKGRALFGGIYNDEEE